MATTAERFSVEITFTGKDKVSGVTGTVVKSMEKLGKAVIAGGAAIVGGLAAAGIAFAKLAIDAAPVQAVADAFNAIANQVEGGADAMLRAMEAASGGMIAQVDLMTSFNKAAQLVSIDFAQRLPDAMGALAKVAAATGQDLDFLFDSLVTGIGRLSPMILDNLGIQVDLVAASQAYADSIGVSVGELTKQQQQTALMNQVMELLMANTAAMPEVMDSAAGGIARMTARFENFKDQVGIIFLPLLAEVLKIIDKIASVTGPLLIAFLEELEPVLTTVVDVFSIFIDRLLAGQTPLDALIAALQLTTPEFESLGINIQPVIDALIFLRDKIMPIITAIIAWIEEHVRLEDVLIALGIALLTVIIPAIGSVLVAIAPVILVFAAVVLAIALMRAAWENDFLGIKTTVLSVFERLKPIWDELMKVLGERLPPLVEKLSAIFNERFKPILEKIGVTLGGDQGLIELLGDLFVNAIGLLVIALDLLLGFLDNIAGPGQALDQVAFAFEMVINLAMSLWNWIIKLGQSFADLTIPDFLKPGSPPPLAVALADINKELGNLTMTILPAFGGGSNQSSIINDNRSFALNIAGTGQENLPTDFETLAGMSGGRIA